MKAFIQKLNKIRNNFLLADNIDDYAKFPAYLTGEAINYHFEDGRDVFNSKVNFQALINNCMNKSYSNTRELLEDNKTILINELQGRIPLYKRLELLVCLCAFQNEVIDAKTIDKINSILTEFLKENNIIVVRFGLSTIKFETQPIDLFAEAFKFSLFIQMRLFELAQDKNQDLEAYLLSSEEKSIINKLKCNLPLNNISRSDLQLAQELIYKNCFNKNLSLFKSNQDKIQPSINNLLQEKNQIISSIKKQIIGNLIICLSGIIVGLILTKKYKKACSAIAIFSAILLPINTVLINAKGKIDIENNKIKHTKQWASEIVKSQKEDIIEYTKHLRGQIPV